VIGVMRKLREIHTEVTELRLGMLTVVDQWRDYFRFHAMRVPTRKPDTVCIRRILSPLQREEITIKWSQEGLEVYKNGVPVDTGRYGPAFFDLMESNAMGLDWYSGRRL
jgi:hypothetical protein